MTLPTIICFSNIGYKDFADNFLLNIVDVIHQHKVVYYCLDEELYQYLIPKYKKNNICIERFHNNTENLSGFENFGSSNFVRLMDTKMDLIKMALEKYGFIHVVDADIVFIKELTESYYEKYSEYDIVYQKDAPLPGQSNIWTCTGNWLLKNNSSTINFLNKIIEVKSRFPTYGEQEAQREIFSSAGISDIHNYPDAKLTEFPPEEITCGFYVRDNIFRFDSILVFHANHVTGYHAKVQLLKKINKWYLLEN